MKLTLRSRHQPRVDARLHEEDARNDPHNFRAIRVERFDAARARGVESSYNNCVIISCSIE